MGAQWSALVRAVRTAVQGALAAGAIAAWEAAYTAWEGGTFNGRLVAMAVITAGAGAVITYLWNIVAPKLGLVDRPSVEAFVRAARTLAQAVVGIALVALWDSIYAAWLGGTHNPRDLAAGAVAAVVTAVVAYLHNLVQSYKGDAQRVTVVRSTDGSTTRIRARLDE